jgi:hypothetical protein
MLALRTIGCNRFFSSAKNLAKLALLPVVCPSLQLLEACSKLALKKIKIGARRN